MEHLNVYDDIDRDNRGRTISNTYTALINKNDVSYKLSNESKWYEMAFKYDITEFCTSIKPKTLLYMLSKGFDKVIYFDPDIMFFSSVAPIFDALDNKPVERVPVGFWFHFLKDKFDPSPAQIEKNIEGHKKFVEEFIIEWKGKDI